MGTDSQQTAGNQSVSGSRVPGWATRPFQDFLDHIELLSELLHISMRGIAALRGMPGLIDALRDVVPEEKKDKYSNEKLDRARKEAELAQAEVENGYPMLNGLMAIALWGSLEALVKTFLSAWLSNMQDARTCEQIKKLKIRIGEYESWTPEDRYFHVLDLLEEALATRRSPGVARFEALFDVFGFSSTVDEGVSRGLLELYHVRNVLVHCRGVADRKFVRSCPWLGVEVGAKVTVTHKDFQRYREAAGEYVLELVQRLRGAFGVARYVAKEAVTSATEANGVKT